VDGVQWHVQTRGEGPALLMIHGTGASSHSWAALADILADRFTLVMPDLPGQGFSSALPPEEVCIEGFARRLQGLLQALGIRPKLW
jgi:magnesium chelatase accessory protein